MWKREKAAQRLSASSSLVFVFHLLPSGKIGGKGTNFSKKLLAVLSEQGDVYMGMPES